MPTSRAQNVLSFSLYRFTRQNNSIYVSALNFNIRACFLIFLSFLFFLTEHKSCARQHNTVRKKHLTFLTSRPCRIYYEQVRRQLTRLKVCHLRQGRQLSAKVFHNAGSSCEKTIFSAAPLNPSIVRVLIIRAGLMMPIKLLRSVSPSSGISSYRFSSLAFLLPPPGHGFVPTTAFFRPFDASASKIKHPFKHTSTKINYIPRVTYILTRVF